MIRRPPRSTPFPTRRSSDLYQILASSEIKVRLAIESFTYRRDHSPSQSEVHREIRGHTRSEEHTSELQSQSNLVCRLLLGKKKKLSEHDSYRLSHRR